jgi:hypothetical protein
VFATTRHWSLSCAKCIQFAPTHPVSLRSILILSYNLRLGLPSGLFPFRFSDQNFLCISHLSHACYMPRSCHSPPPPPPEIQYTFPILIFPFTCSFELCEGAGLSRSLVTLHFVPSSLSLRMTDPESVALLEITGQGGACMNLHSSEQYRLVQKQLTLTFHCSVNRLNMFFPVRIYPYPFWKLLVVTLLQI